MTFRGSPHPWSFFPPGVFPFFHTVLDPRNCALAYPDPASHPVALFQKSVHLCTMSRGFFPAHPLVIFNLLTFLRPVKGPASTHPSTPDLAIFFPAIFSALCLLRTIPTPSPCVVADPTWTNIFVTSAAWCSLLAMVAPLLFSHQFPLITFDITGAVFFQRCLRTPNHVFLLLGPLFSLSPFPSLRFVVCFACVDLDKPRSSLTTLSRGWASFTNRLVTAPTPSVLYSVLAPTPFLFLRGWGPRHFVLLVALNLFNERL